MKKLALIGGILAVLVLLAVLLLPALAWSGSTSVEFRFRIVEFRSNRPVKDAKVRVIPGSRLWELSDTNLAGVFPAKITDGTGLIIVSVRCDAGGGSGLFGKTGRFGISHELLVEADGYRPLSTALANVVGGRRWPLSKRVFDVELILFKNP